MEKAFQDLEKAGKNDVDNLIKWMKDSKIIDQTKDDEKVRKLFKDAGAEQKVGFDKFKAVVTQLAAEKSKTLEQLSKQLADEAPKILNVAREGLNAAREGLSSVKGALMGKK